MASLRPELITEIGGFPITNTIITTLVVDIVLLALIFLMARRISLVPGGIQSYIEPVVIYLRDMTDQIAGHASKVIFPWFASFFFFILFANLIALLPGFGSIGFWETTNENGHAAKHFIPLLRASMSDFNVTLALGTVSVLATHMISIHFNGFWGYIRKFLSFSPVYLFIGLLEFLLEGVKIFSLSFRLFGNIYAGEVVLMTVSGIAAFIAPIPFLLLETIVALVQALVFAMLTMVFMTILSSKNGH